jgi:hypothetical protein
VSGRFPLRFNFFIRLHANAGVSECGWEFAQAPLPSERLQLFISRARSRSLRLRDCVLSPLTLTESAAASAAATNPAVLELAPVAVPAPGGLCVAGYSAGRGCGCGCAACRPSLAELSARAHGYVVADIDAVLSAAAARAAFRSHYRSGDDSGSNSWTAGVADPGFCRANGGRCERGADETRDCLCDTFVGGSRGSSGGVDPEIILTAADLAAAFAAHWPTLLRAGVTGSGGAGGIAAVEEVGVGGGGGGSGGGGGGGGSGGSRSSSSGVRWRDLGGLGAAKRSLRETVTLPARRPELLKAFGLTPPSALLLYGPPGS